jgi:tryptophanyl-tRNA synthetase
LTNGTVNANRVLSGMRPTGALHLGHYHGVLKSWLKLQHEYECFFFAADWHALTTEYEHSEIIAQSTWDMVIDWLAVGINPGAAKIFIQSLVPEHAELHLMLSMVTPLAWLERVPTYKDQMERLKERDLATYGFLGYPLLQSADILIYRAGIVPVGEDQLPHLELTREVARRFNHLFGREPGFAERAEAAIKTLGKKNAKLYRELRAEFQERGQREALEKARAMLADQKNITIADRERLSGYLEGEGRVILPEPQPMLTHVPKFPGLDGQKMSKSYGNTIGLRESSDSIVKRLKTMPTDPARVRRSDPGDPLKCPVWDFHKVYSDEKTRDWVMWGCRNAGIGCLECKQPVLDAILAEVEPIRERAQKLAADPATVRDIVADGCRQAREVAQETLQEVRRAVGLVDIM